MCLYIHTHICDSTKRLILSCVILLSGVHWHCTYHQHTINSGLTVIDIVRYDKHISCDQDQLHKTFSLDTKLPLGGEHSIQDVDSVCLEI